MKAHFKEMGDFLTGVLFTLCIWFHTWFWNNLMELSGIQLLAFPLAILSSIFILICFLFKIYAPIYDYVVQHWDD